MKFAIILILWVSFMHNPRADIPIQCRPGHIPSYLQNNDGTLRGTCTPCPINSHCNGIDLYPGLCAKGFKSIEGSSRCCAITDTSEYCPDGFAINMANCQCTRIQCDPNIVQESQKNTIYSKIRRSLHQDSNGNLQCKTPSKCKACVNDDMILNEKTCMCVKVMRCGKGQNMWRSETSDTYVCM